LVRPYLIKALSWCVKEALVKALGLGLSILADIEVSFLSESEVGSVSQEGLALSEYSIHIFELDENHIAVAVGRSSTEI
jgi:phosphopantetheinyl transferase